MTHIVMIVVGAIALVANLNPPKYLQALVVFCTSRTNRRVLRAARHGLLLATRDEGRRARRDGRRCVDGARALRDRLDPQLVRLRPRQESARRRLSRRTSCFGVEPIVWGIVVSGIVGIV